MKTFEEYMATRPEVVTENAATWAQAPEKTVQDFIKKQIDINIKVWPLGDKGVHKYKMTPVKSPHGNLCSSYTVSLDAGMVKDAKHGEYWSVRVNLNWEYKDGATNGTEVGTIFVSNTGTVIATRLPGK